MPLRKTQIWKSPKESRVRSREIVEGEIMKMGYTFTCFMRKKNCIFTSSSTSGIQKYFFYLEFHFTIKTKLVKNFVSFPLTIFQIIFIEI